MNPLPFRLVGNPLLRPGPSQDLLTGLLGKILLPLLQNSKVNLYKIFSVIATSHITRGEYDELHKLQSTLEQSDMKVATKFYSNVVFSLARMGQIDLLESVLKLVKRNFSSIR